MLIVSIICISKFICTVRLHLRLLFLEIYQLVKFDRCGRLMTTGKWLPNTQIKAKSLNTAPYRVRWFLNFLMLYFHCCGNETIEGLSSLNKQFIFNAQSRCKACSRMWAFLISLNNLHWRKNQRSNLILCKVLSPCENDQLWVKATSILANC